MARDRLMSLRQVQRVLASGSIGYQFNEERPVSNAPSLSNESHIIEIEQSNKQAEIALKGFLDKVADIRGQLNDLKEDVKTVDKKQNEILASPYTTTEPLKHELDELMSRVKTTTKVIRARLREIEVEISKEAESGNKKIYMSASHRIKKTQHGTLLGQFVDCVNEYLTSQANYQDRCKDKMKRQLSLIGNNSLDDEQLDNLMENQDQWSVFTQGIISQPTITKKILDEIEDRHEQIKKLETSIVELHSVFIEMSILVEAQGERINRIEDHVNSSLEYVEEAAGKLKKAKEYQSSARKKKFMIGGGVSIFLIIILIIIIVVLT